MLFSNTIRWYPFSQEGDVVILVRTTTCNSIPIILILHHVTTEFLPLTRFTQVAGLGIELQRRW